jgi:hypothetical protein
VKRLRVLVAVLVVAVMFAVAAGCGMTGKLTGTLNANKAPETVLFVSGELDTVNHIVHLYWLGSDADGEVTGFEWRLLNPETPADTNWRFTTLTDSIFTVHTPNGYADTRFSVRAIDDDGLRDPEPPVQKFEFSNQVPVVRFQQKPAPTDTTFASVSVTWLGIDVDGDVAKLTYLVWLDGNEATPEITTSTAFTMPTDRFSDANDVFTPGVRKIYVRAIDDGGRAGPADSAQWNVRSPVTGPNARLLIVDDCPRLNASNLRFDTLYSNSAGRIGLLASEYSILRLDVTQPFRTAKDVEQTFNLFDAVVWYRANEVTFSTVLDFAEPGISAYLDQGGRFYLDGLYLINGRNATGPLSEDFVRRHMHSRGMKGAFTVTPTFTDTSIGFGNTGTSVFLPHVTVNGVVGRDSMYVRTVFQVRPGEAGGLRQFDYLDKEEVALWGAPGTLTPDLGDSTAVGMSVPQPGGGRAILVCMAPGATVPPAGAGIQAGSAAKFMTNIFRQLVLNQP